MKIVPIHQVNMEEVIQILERGGLIVFPCETVYGVGGDAHNSAAVVKLSTYKARPLGKPYAVMVANADMAEKYVEVNETAKNLYASFLPGPVTVISKGKHTVADGVESESGTLGVRIPDYKFMLELLEKFGRAIASSSANASYQRRPYKLDDIWNNISDKQKALIDLAIDAGELPHNEPSTVIDTTLDDTVVLRQGDIKLKNINEVMSRSEENTQNVAKELWQKYDHFSGQRTIIFALAGEMGSGKTQFAKGLGKTLGITEDIVSPTYSLEEEYDIKSTARKFIHIDAWRMASAEELESLGIKGLIDDKAVMAIEWADRVDQVIRKYNEEAIIVWVKIEYGKKENERIISWGTT